MKKSIIFFGTILCIGIILTSCDNKKKDKVIPANETVNTSVTTPSISGNDEETTAKVIEKPTMTIEQYAELECNYITKEKAARDVKNEKEKEKYDKLGDKLRKRIRKMFKDDDESKEHFKELVRDCRDNLKEETITPKTPSKVIEKPTMTIEQYAALECKYLTKEKAARDVKNQDEKEKYDDLSDKLRKRVSEMFKDDDASKDHFKELVRDCRDNLKKE